MEEDDLFSPNILKIEEEVVEFLSKSPLLFTKDSCINQIRGLFFTRKDLTQKKLKKLTQLSTGKISQVLKTLRRWKLIEKTSVSSIGEFTYSMKSIENSCRNYFHTIVEEMTRSIKPLEEIKAILDKEGDKIKNLRGYDRISHLIPMFLKAMKINIEIMEEFNVADLGEKKV